MPIAFLRETIIPNKPTPSKGISEYPKELMMEYNDRN
jgi:hypothetical protein